MQVWASGATSRANVTNLHSPPYIVTNNQFIIVITQVSVIGAIVTGMVNDDQFPVRSAVSQKSYFAIGYTNTGVPVGAA